jgi:hypothetical protein
MMPQRACESISHAIATSSNHASGFATNSPCPSTTSGFHMAGGSTRLRCSSMRAFASATDRMPAPTSRSTSRGSREPRWPPASSSAASWAGAHNPRCTTSAMTERTTSRSRIRRTASIAARSSGASGQRPGPGIGSRSVRSTITSPYPLRRRSAGTRRCTGPLGRGAFVRPCSSRASMPVISASGPACNSPPRRRSFRVGGPLCSSTRPGASRCHGPPARQRCAMVSRCSPSSTRSRTRTTGPPRYATRSSRYGVSVRRRGMLPQSRCARVAAG